MLDLKLYFFLKYTLACSYPNVSFLSEITSTVSGEN